MPEPKQIHQVADAAALADCARRLGGVATLAIDTESNSMHVYQEQVCWLQIEADGEVWLIDGLAFKDLEPLSAILADPSVETILHGADYDVVCLGRDYGLKIGGLYDTMVAAQFLERPALGLAALCREAFGVELDKSLTRHDWGRRPLGAQYLRYMVDDVIHLRALKEGLAAEIVAAGIEEELSLEFRRVESLSWSRSEFDVESWRRIKGARDLSPREQALTASLFVLRDEIARERNLPAYKVLHNEALLAVARSPIAREGGDLHRLKALRPNFVGRYHDRIQDALARGRASEPPPPLPRRPRPDRKIGERHDRLRDWRRDEARRRKVANIVVLPNHVLEQLADQPPQSLAELAAIPYLGASRLERYGDKLLELIS